MPDISMCKNEDCPSKEKCYRYKAKPSEFWQSWATYLVNKDRKKCDSFYPLKK